MADENRIGLFPVSYEIGTGAPGAPLFTVHLLVYTANRTVTGGGLITQAILPPNSTPTKLEGSYVTVLIMGAPYNIVTAAGHAVEVWPPLTEPGPVLQPNVNLQMTLSGDWQSGTATYTYIDESGSHTVTDVPVKLVSNLQTA